MPTSNGCALIIALLLSVGKKNLKGSVPLKEKVMEPIDVCAPINPSLIPAVVGKDIARTILPAILRDYADPEIQADYQRWKAARHANTQK